MADAKDLFRWVILLGEETSCRLIVHACDHDMRRCLNFIERHDGPLPDDLVCAGAAGSHWPRVEDACLVFSGDRTPAQRVGQTPGGDPYHEKSHAGWRGFFFGLGHGCFKHQGLTMDEDVAEMASATAGFGVSSLGAGFASPSNPS